MVGLHLRVPPHRVSPLARLADGPVSNPAESSNLLASVLALAVLDLDLDAATQALATFEGLPHRRQEVGEVRGVRYVDDSKATNVGAAIHALEMTSG